MGPFIHLCLKENKGTKAELWITRLSFRMGWALMLPKVSLTDANEHLYCQIRLTWALAILKAARPSKFGNFILSFVPLFCFQHIMCHISIESYSLCLHYEIVCPTSFWPVWIGTGLKSSSVVVAPVHQSGSILLNRSGSSSSSSSSWEGEITRLDRTFQH